MIQRHNLFAAFLVAAALIVGCSKSDESSSTTVTSGGGATTQPTAAGGGNTGGATINIAVIPKGTTHSFWKSVEAGANKAGAELGVNVQWKGPLQENDRAQQIQIVQQFTSQGINGIVVAPLDNQALKRPIDEAMNAKIPVVIIDSALNGEVGKDFVSFVATDNRKGGQMGGEQLAKVLGGKGKVVLLRYQVGSASTDEREAGFLDAMKKNPDIQIIVDNRYAGATMGEAKDSAMQMLDKLQEADGIFCPNESSTQGMLLALRQAGLAGKKKFVGFDASSTLVEGLNKGEIDALVSQNPTKMGYEGVKAIVAAVKGEKVEPRIDTGCQLITKDNVNTPEIKQLLGTQ